MFKPFGTLDEELVDKKHSEQDRPDECILVGAKNYAVVNRR